MSATAEAAGPGGDGRALSSLTARDSLRARVTEALREAMVAGEMEPGRMYSAPSLAKMLGVSATPVREAMIDLTREGLVETIRYRGYRVVEVDDRALDEMVELRALIEVPTIGRVARLGEPERVEALRPLARELVETAEDGRFQAFIAADTEFHLRLLALAGNRQIVEEVRRLRGQARLSGLRELREAGRLVETAREHESLLDLLAAGDAEGAEALMLRHLQHVRGVWAGLPEA